MPHSIDEELMARLSPYLVTDYEKLHYNKTPGLQNTFIGGQVQNFELTYNEPKTINFADAFYNLEKIKDDVVHYESVVCRAYLPKLQELKNRFALLHATSIKDDKAFFEQSEILYGLPKLAYYRYALRGMDKLLLTIKDLNLGDSRVEQALEILAPLHTENTPSSWDSIRLPTLVTAIDNRILKTDEIKMMCEQAFIDYDVKGWKAVVARPGDRITFNVNQEENVLYIPHDDDIQLRKYPLTRIKMEALIAHEIGTHIVRRQNGDNSPLALLGSGLDSYLHGEEGIATYREQKVRGASKFSGILGYLAISFVVGLDGKPRSFRELFDIMVPYLFLSVIEQRTRNNHSLNLDIIEDHVKRNAWARCIRTFRGVTGQNPGYCLTRDIIYLEGNIAIWQLLEAEPNFEKNFSIGKYDPTNKEHVSILHELGLLQ